MKRTLWLLACFTFAAGASRTQAQVGISVHGGSLGVGVDIGYAVHPRVTLRAGGNFFPFSLDITASDIEYAFDFPSPSVELAASGAVTQVDLTAEAAEFEDDISVFKYYPIVTLGFSFAMPGGRQ